jgi:hypothetical protein
MMLRASHSEDQKFVHKPDLKKPLEDLGKDSIIILKWALQK